MPSVLLTRPLQRSHHDDEIHTLLTAASIAIVELPMISFELPRDTEALDAAILEAAGDHYDYVILSSPTAADFLQERLIELELATAVQVMVRFGAVGQATAQRLSTYGYNVELPIPINAGANELIARLASEGLSGKRILLLQSQIGLETLEYCLNELGAIPHRVTLYYTKGPTIGDSARLLTLLESERRPDVIAFFSPSSVAYFITAVAEMASVLLRNLPPIACIGETTAKAVEEALHRRPEIVARKADQRSLAEDIIRYLQTA